jgi:hypothetical protein
MNSNIFETVTFEVREEAVGIGQPDSVAKYGIGESIGREGEVLEDDYGIAVEPERFVDIVTGVDPSKFTKGSGRIGDDVRRKGLGLDGKLDPATSLSQIQGQLENDDMVSDSLDEELAFEAKDLSEGTGIIRGRNNRPPVKVSTEIRLFEVSRNKNGHTVTRRIKVKPEHQDSEGRSLKLSELWTRGYLGAISENF